MNIFIPEVAEIQSPSQKRLQAGLIRQPKHRSSILPKSIVVTKERKTVCGSKKWIMLASHPSISLEVLYLSFLANIAYRGIDQA